LIFKGSDRAAGLAEQAMGAPALKLFAEGKAIKQASYDMQHQDWSKTQVVGQPARLAMVEQQGKLPLPDAPDHMEALERVSTGQASMGSAASPVPPPYPPMVAEALQLAAIAALGEASDDMYDRLAPLAADDLGAGQCLHEAKLNLYQCLAVAKPHYEDVYCMGQHAMSDVGACLTINVGLKLPPEPPPPPPPAPLKKTTVSHRKHTR
jgi:hypothetical protein